MLSLKAPMAPPTILQWETVTGRSALPSHYFTHTSYLADCGPKTFEISALGQMIKCSWLLSPAPMVFLIPCNLRA